jgi:hypothetical protein
MTKIFWTDLGHAFVSSNAKPFKTTVPKNAPTNSASMACAPPPELPRRLVALFLVESQGFSPFLAASSAGRLVSFFSPWPHVPVVTHDKALLTISKKRTSDP